MFWKDWESASGIAKAFKIGAKESQAVRVLVHDVAPTVVAKLEACVKERGLGRLMVHDCIGKGTFSVGFTSAAGATEGWADELRNHKNDHRLAPR